MRNSQRQSNLDTLDQLFPGIKKNIEERKEELLKKEQLEIEEETALDGEIILKVKKNNRALYLAGRRDPAGPARKQFGLLGKIEPTAPIFIVGLGNIHYLEEVTRHTDQSVMLFIYEPSFTIFYKVLELVDLQKIFANHLVVLCVEGINAEHYEVLMRQMLNGDRVAIMKNFILPNYEELFLEPVYKFVKSLDKIVKEYRITVNTLIEFSPVRVENIFNNMNAIRVGYKAGQLQDILPLDVPAIVVSAGPSLNKNIQELKRAKNKAFIIAVDTAMKPLLNAGIVPDMFAIVDGLKPLHLVEVEESRQIPLVTTDDAAKAILEYHQGKKFFYDQGRRYINHIYEMNHKSFEGLIVGGSVATLAISLVCHVGFKTVILVGQDLAYTNNRTHADGTFHEKMEEIDTSGYKMVEGNVEKQVPTDVAMDGYREWIEDFITHWRRYVDIKVINATEGGAKIKGTEVMPLKEAIDRECKKTVNIKECFDKLEPAFTKEEQRKILSFFRETPYEFHKIVMAAEDGRKLYLKLQKMCENNNLNLDGYQKLLRKIKKLNKRIENSIVYEFIEETMMLADQIVKTGQYREYSSFKDEGLEIAQNGMKYMELVQQCAKLFEGLAERTVASVESDG